MNKIITLAIFCLLGSGLFAQETFEGKFKFDKKVSPTANGVAWKTANDPEAVKSSIEAKFLEVARVKSKKGRKGMFVFEGVIYPEISSAKMDYYFRIDPIGKDMNQVHMFLSLGNDNFISSLKFPQEIEAAKRFLYNLDKGARIMAMMEKINSQQEELMDQEKAKGKLVKEQEDLKKAHEKLTKEMQENELKQEQMVGKVDEMTQKVEEARTTLDSLKAQLEAIKNE
ncbi:MAG: hypothetical protein AAFY71_15645 [Bacteroidota bacterium]